MTISATIDGTMKTRARVITCLIPVKPWEVTVDQLIKRLSY